MKYIILAIFLFGCSPKRNPARAQTDSCLKYYDDSLKMDVYKYADQMPSYPGGFGEALFFVNKNLKYPADMEQFQSSVRIRFVIDKTGRITNMTVDKKEKKDYSKLDLEMMRVMGLMPKWIPGSCNGKKVPVSFVYPITLCNPEFTLILGADYSKWNYKYADELKVKSFTWLGA